MFSVSKAPSLRSSSSNASRFSDAAARAAALKAELKFIEIEARSKAELQKIQTLKEIEKAEAEVAALRDIERSACSPRLLSAVPISEASVSVESCPSSTPVVCTALASSGPSVVVETETVVVSSLADVPVNLNTAGNPPDASVSNHVVSLDPNAATFTPGTTSEAAVGCGQNLSSPNPSNLLDLAKSFVEQINLSRLPCPEPGVFSGDPMTFPGWKAEFHTLIEQRQIPPLERIHYLKRYVSGPVKEVIEVSCRQTRHSVRQKKALEERYGDSFVITDAFRNKLEHWPKIQSRDNIGLRKFSDLLNQCCVVMTTIKGLSVLNDDRENRKLLLKLPEWVVTRWARIVSKLKDAHGEFRLSANLPSSWQRKPRSHATQ